MLQLVSAKISQFWFEITFEVTNVLTPASEASKELNFCALHSNFEQESLGRAPVAVSVATLYEVFGPDCFIGC